MTLPNKLSLSRIIMIPFFVIVLMVERWPIVPSLPVVGAMHALALVLVIAGSVTDWLDGKIARERGLTSTLGKLLDPLADKLLVCSAFVGFVELRIFPAWIIIIILCREFLVTGLRSLGTDQGRIIAADRWGKHKTGWQLATIITTLTFMTTRDFLQVAGVWDDPLDKHWNANAIYTFTLHAVLFVAVALTLISGWLCVWKNRDLLKDG